MEVLRFYAVRSSGCIMLVLPFAWQQRIIECSPVQIYIFQSKDMEAADHRGLYCLKGLI